ncbi:MAG: calcium-translocating P-type ATPase, SERCA-type, partial [archaeon]
MAEFYSFTVEETLKELGTSLNGLTDAQALEKKTKYGLNKIHEKKGVTKTEIFLNQFKSLIIWILIAAAVISFFIGETVDAIIILILVAVNSLIGFIQEFNADKSIQELKKLMNLKAVIKRNGKTIEIDSQQLVPGDLILLEEGMKVPADIRLIEAIELHSMEASLTGESMPVRKQTEKIAEAVLADRKNMLFSGTIISKGKGKGIVVSTGMNTEIGKIANLLQEQEEEPTLLQKKLAVLGKWLGIATIIICAMVFFSLIVSFHATGAKSIADAFMVAVSLAVAAIPEGLPAIVTISLALGIQRMVKKKALVRRLPAVETLGSVDVICSDKTGTLTRNEMTVREIYFSGKKILVTGEGFKGKFTAENDSETDLSLILNAGVLCNNSVLEGKNLIGDPTETSLLVAGAKAGIIKEKLEEIYPRIGEIPFSSERKLMTSIHSFKGKKISFSKGAPDIVLELCTKIFENGSIRAITFADKEKIKAINEEMAEKTMRVLGFAFKDQDTEKEDRMIFIGLQAMNDPPRKEVKYSLELCRQAGIKVIMITGDYLGTAKAIAKELGLGNNSMTGQELEEISEKELEEKIDGIDIFARVNPSHKMKIINALKAKNHVVAMTGDGVNDAPALKKADIGIAMGIKGTDIAKESSEMILLDDNFSSIVAAVEEGRGIYDNIKKFVNYLLSCNLGEVLLIFSAILIWWESPEQIIPLIPIQLLWLNIVTDGLPALALGLDPAEKGIMKRKPRNSAEQIINKEMLYSIVFVGVIIAAATLYLFAIHLPDLALAQTVAFTSLVVFEIFRLQAIRSNFSIGVFSNKWLIGAVITSFALQLAVIYTPLNVFFKTVPLGLNEWIAIIGVAFALFIASMAFNKIIKN